MTTETSAPETKPFQAEVTQLLRLVINSLYSNKEIFLRELVSNASDAIDKLRFRAISQPDLAKGDGTLRIRITPDEDAGTLTIEDNGVGMTRDELVKNLGTIAHSGTRAFLDELSKKGTQDAKLIGQFGVGFYSAFLVADSVTVESRAAGAGDSWRWHSDAKESFTIEKGSRDERGTAVILHLKEDQTDFLKSWRVKELVEKYSDFVAHPIEVKKSEGDDYETANRGKALWTRPKGEITDEQYEQFFAHLTSETEEPIARTHFTVEGSQQFTGLFFIPRSLPFEVLRDPRKGGVRLFVQRVFIMDDCDALLPSWMRFIRGIIDSDDLPLNVSRELLQDSAVVRSIKKASTKKVLDLLDDLTKNRKDDYAAFWRAFGPVLKEGLSTDWDHKDRIANLWRFESTSQDEGELTGFEDYVSRMKEGQKEIYYAIGESRESLAESPYTEALRKAGYEVALLTDPVDEWSVESLREYKGKRLVSAMRADVKLPDAANDKERKERDTSLEPVLKKARQVLGGRVGEVRTSDRLTDSAACLVLPAGAPHLYMERVLKETGRSQGESKRILEVNPTHPLVLALKTICERKENDPRLDDWIEVLYDQALLTEGRAPEDPNRFAKRVTALLSQVAGSAANG